MPADTDLPREIMPNEAASLHSISTLHHQMANGEYRFRLKHGDGTAYIRTEADETGGWQRSHYHANIMETYIVQVGWMGFAEVIDKRVRLRLFSAGEAVTTQPTVVHNVYLPAHSVIHTVKHGKAMGEDRETDCDAAALDLFTDKLQSKAEIRAMAMRSPTEISYSEDYRHFDGLIWQVPALSTAIFALSIQEAFEVLGKPDVTHIQAQLGGWLMLLLAMFLFGFSVILMRFRSHQRNLKPYSNTAFWKSASTWSQSLVLLQSAVLLGLGMALLGMIVLWSILIAVFGWISAVIMSERSIRNSQI